MFFSFLFASGITVSNIWICRENGVMTWSYFTELFSLVVLLKCKFYVIFSNRFLSLFFLFSGFCWMITVLFLATLLAMATSICLSIHHFDTDWNISTIIVWIAMKVCSDIHGPETMCPNHLSCPLKCLHHYWLACHEMWFGHPAVLCLVQVLKC